MSIRLRVFLAFLLLVGCGIGYLLYWTVRELKPQFREAVEDPLVDAAEILAAEISFDIKDGRLDPARLGAAVDRAKSRKLSARIYSREKTGVDLRVIAVDKSGRVIFDSLRLDLGADYSNWNDISRTLRGEYGARSTRSQQGDPESSTLYVAAPILVDNQIAGAVSVGKPAAANNTLIERVRRRVWLGAAITLAGALILALLVTSWVSLPIRRLTAYAEAVRDQKRPPLPAVGAGEMQRLRDSFEEMRIELEGKQYVERYIQGLTHELKSPLAAIQGAAELLTEELPADDRNRFTRNIIRESDRMRRTIDKLLTLAGIERMAGIGKSEQFDLAEVAAECAGAEQNRISQRQIQIEIEQSESRLVEGIRALAAQAVSNIISNAIEFSNSGQQIKLSVAAAADGVGTVLTCIDSGPGIPPYAAEKIFERFYSLTRPGSGEKSSGLGLAIVKEVMDLHCGRIRIINRPEGGVLAELYFPPVLVRTAS